MKPHCLVDGEASASVPADDRGLQYGDGLFETIAATGGHIELQSEHLARLARGAEKLGMGPVDEAALRDEIGVLSDPAIDQVIKIIVTRGSGQRGYRSRSPGPPNEPTPRRIVSVHAWPDHDPSLAMDGVRVMSCATRLPLDPELAGIKTLNRLHQVLAANEVAAAAHDEGIMLDVTGRVVCGTMSNVFSVKNNRVQTPALDRCGIAGVMRDQIRHVAAELNIDIEMGTLMSGDLLEADEVFVTNSLIGLWPVRRIDGKEKSVGPLTLNIREALFRKLSRRVSP